MLAMGNYHEEIIIFMLKKSPQKNLALTSEEQHKFATFIVLLMSINKRVYSNKSVPKKEQQAKKKRESDDLTRRKDGQLQIKLYEKLVVFIMGEILMPLGC